jgi:hypothetical protein
MEISSLKIELVIARYNESLDWLLEGDFSADQVTIYNKGPTEITLNPRRRHQPVNFQQRIFQLSNVGRESHTFLHHIVENYDNLAEVTVFLPGSCMSESKESKTRRVLDKVKENKVSDTFDTVIFGKWYVDVKNDTRLKNFTIAAWTGTTSANASILPDKDCAPSPIARPFHSWFNHFFGVSLKINVVSYTSIFAVAKSHILQHPVEYYRGLLAAVSHHSNPEDGHYLERSWVAVFHPLPERCLHTDRPVQDSEHSTGLAKVDNRKYYKNMLCYAMLYNKKHTLFYAIQYYTILQYAIDFCDFF